MSSITDYINENPDAIWCDECMAIHDAPACQMKSSAHLRGWTNRSQTAREHFYIQTHIIDLRGLGSTLRYGEAKDMSSGEHKRAIDSLLEKGIAFACGGRQRP